MQGWPTSPHRLRQASSPERRWQHRLLLLLLISLAILPLLAEAGDGPIALDGSQERIELGPQLQFLRDPHGTRSLGSLLYQQDGWQPASGQAVNFGIDRSDWWFRVDLQNRSGRELETLLEIAYPTLDHVDIFLVADNTLVERITLGDQLPFAARPVDHHYFVVPLRWPVDETRTLLIHVRTNGVVQLPITLWEPAAFASHDQKRQLVSGLYFGAMLVMLAYNLFMFIGIGDRSYLYYVGFVSSVPLFVSSLTGYSFQYFWPESMRWNGQSIGFFLTTTVLFGLLFTHEFLQLSRSSLHAFIRGGARAVLLMSLLMLVVVFTTSYNTMLMVIMAGCVVACCSALVIGIYGTLRGERAALFYVLAWSALLLGGLILAASKLSLLPQNAFTDNAVQLGSIMLVVLLSFALAERINDERRRRYRAQMEALQNERRARLAQEQALNAQQQANLQLEQKVAERTLELEKANTILQELSDTDGLTGLRNRRFLDGHLNREMTRCFRYQRSLAVILLDIDHFKAFNDQYGHQVGDDCLRMVAQQLQHCVSRDSDVVARYGGEEFCVILPETDREGAVAVAERIRRRIEQTPFPVAGENVQVSVSLGVTARVPEAPGQEAPLLQLADEALYRSKHAGRNRVSFLPE